MYPKLNLLNISSNYKRYSGYIRKGLLAKSKYNNAFDIDLETESDDAGLIYLSIKSHSQSNNTSLDEAMDDALEYWKWRNIGFIIHTNYSDHYVIDIIKHRGEYNSLLASCTNFILNNKTRSLYVASKKYEEEVIKRYVHE